jgi:hypothetical protein
VSSNGNYDVKAMNGGATVSLWSCRAWLGLVSPFRNSFLVVLVAAILFLSGCFGKRLTKANVDQVESGMSRKQVESILGPPTSIDSTDLIVTKKVTYEYKQGDEIVTIVFFNDKVSSKESNLHD